MNILSQENDLSIELGKYNKDDVEPFPMKQASINITRWNGKNVKKQKNQTPIEKQEGQEKKALDLSGMIIKTAASDIEDDEEFFETEQLSQREIQKRSIIIDIANQGPQSPSFLLKSTQQETRTISSQSQFSAISEEDEEFLKVVDQKQMVRMHTASSSHSSDAAEYTRPDPLEGAFNIIKTTKMVNNGEEKRVTFDTQQKFVLPRYKKFKPTPPLYRNMQRRRPSQDLQSFYVSKKTKIRQQRKKKPIKREFPRNLPPKRLYVGRNIIPLQKQQQKQQQQQKQLPRLKNLVIKPDTKSVLKPKAGDIQISSQMTPRDRAKEPPPWERSSLQKEPHHRHSNAYSIAASQVSDLQPFGHEEIESNMTEDVSDQSDNPLLRIKVRSNRNSIASHQQRDDDLTDDFQQMRLITANNDLYHSKHAYAPLDGRPNTSQDARTTQAPQDALRRHSTTKVNHDLNKLNYEYDPVEHESNVSQADSVFDLGSLPDLSISTKRPSLVQNLDDEETRPIDPPPQLSPILAENAFEEAETVHIQKKKTIVGPPPPPKKKKKKKNVPLGYILANPKYDYVHPDGLTPFQLSKKINKKAISKQFFPLSSIPSGSSPKKSVSKKKTRPTPSMRDVEINDSFTLTKMKIRRTQPYQPTPTSLQPEFPELNLAASPSSPILADQKPRFLISSQRPRYEPTPDPITARTKAVQEAIRPSRPRKPAIRRRGADRSTPNFEPPLLLEMISAPSSRKSRRQKGRRRKFESQKK